MDNLQDDNRTNGRILCLSSPIPVSLATEWVSEERRKEFRQDNEGRLSGDRYFRWLRNDRTQ